MRQYNFRPPFPDSAQPLPSDNSRQTRWPRVIAKLVVVLVAGSGILNLVSLLGGPVPADRPEWVRGLFRSNSWDYPAP